MSRLIAISIIFASAFSANVIAKAQRTLHDVIPVDQQHQLSIKVSVGEFVLTTSDDNQIHLSVMLKDKHHHWFSSSDLDDVRLIKKINDQRIFLKIDSDELNETWHISVPKRLAIHLDMGVGEAKLSGISHDVDVEIGVGDGEIQLADDNYHHIDAHSKVGDATISGLSGVSKHSALVGQQQHWQGTGQHRASIDVGVGQATISL